MLIVLARECGAWCVLTDLGSIGHAVILCFGGEDGLCIVSLVHAIYNGIMVSIYSARNSGPLLIGSSAVYGCVGGSAS